MPLSKICFSALVAVCSYSGLYAGTADQQKKVYLDSSSIQISGNKIVAETKNGPVLIKTLRTDDCGIFVYEKDMSEFSSKGMKFCSHCHRWMTERQYYSHLPCRG